MCGVSAFNVICFCLIRIAAKMKKPKNSEPEHELISKEIPQDTYDTIQDHPQQEPVRAAWWKLNVMLKWGVCANERKVVRETLEV